MTRKPTAEREYGFKPRVKIGKSKHTWESHADAGTLLKDVLHILDFLAASEPNRFIFSGLASTSEDVQQATHQEQVKAVLTEPPASTSSHSFATGISSRRTSRRGTVVTVSSSSHMKRGNQSSMASASSMRKRIRTETCQSRPMARVVVALAKHCKSAQRAPFVAPVVALVAPSSDFRSTVGSAPRSTDDSSKPTDCEELTDEQVAKWMTRECTRCRLYGYTVRRFEDKELESKRVGPRRTSTSKSKINPKINSKIACFQVFESKPKNRRSNSNSNTERQKTACARPDEYARAKEEKDLADYEQQLARDVAALAAQIAARPLCPICKIKHGPLAEGEVCKVLDLAMLQLTRKTSRLPSAAEMRERSKK